MQTKAIAEKSLDRFGHAAMVKQGTFPVPGVITGLSIGLTNKAEFPSNGSR
jgi:hypothetical protein